MFSLVKCESFLMSSSTFVPPSLVNKWCFKLRFARLKRGFVKNKDKDKDMKTKVDGYGMRSRWEKQSKKSPLCSRFRVWSPRTGSDSERARLRLRNGVNSSNHHHRHHHRNDNNIDDVILTKYEYVQIWWRSTFWSWLQTS